MNIREQAKHIIDVRAKATPAPLKAEGMGSEGYNLYARPEGVALRDVYDAIGFSGRIGEIRSGRDWAQLRGNAEYIAAAWNDAPDIARKLNEALDFIEELVQPRKYDASATRQAAREFLASLEKGDEADV